VSAQWTEREVDVAMVHHAAHAQHAAPDCSGCSRWKQRFDALMVDLENLQTDVLAKNRQITALKAELTRAHNEQVAEEKVQEVFDYWRKACNHPRAKLGDTRHKAIRGRLREGYSIPALKLAIDGAKVGAFVSDGKRYDDIELICRDEVKVEAFIAKGEAAFRFEDSKAYLADGYEELAFYLQASLGPPVVQEGWEFWPCPACQAPSRVLRVSTRARSVCCTSCNAGYADVAHNLYRKDRP
jgi:hypothetical protein